MKTITHKTIPLQEDAFLIKNGKLVYITAGVPLYATLVLLNQKAKSVITGQALAEYQVPQNPESLCSFTFMDGTITDIRVNQLEDFYRLHWPYIIQGKDAKTADAEGLVVENKISSYEEWKQELIKIIARETDQQEHEIKLKEAECLQCYNDGMPPYFAFRESFGD
jgi:hypothetical protein